MLMWSISDVKMFMWDIKNVKMFLSDMNELRVLSLGMNDVIITTRCKYFDPCHARATVVRARFLAAAFSDGSYLAHVNGAYLRHVTFCIVSPISQRGSRLSAH